MTVRMSRLILTVFAINWTSRILAELDDHVAREICAVDFVSRTARTSVIKSKPNQQPSIAIGRCPVRQVSTHFWILASPPQCYLVLSDCWNYRTNAIAISERFSEPNYMQRRRVFVVTPRENSARILASMPRIPSIQRRSVNTC